MSAGAISAVSAIAPVPPTPSVAGTAPTGAAGPAAAAQHAEIETAQMQVQQQMFSQLMQNTNASVMSLATQSPKEDDEDD